MFVLLCGALGCISAAIASLGTSFGVLQGAWRALWKVLRVPFVLLGASLGALQKRICGLLEPLWGILRKPRGIKNDLRRQYARQYLKYI